MEICGLDMKEAYELYVDAGFNFEVVQNLLRQLLIASSTPSNPPLHTPLLPTLLSISTNPSSP